MARKLNKRKKQTQLLKSVRRVMTGLVFKFETDDPLSPDYELTPGSGSVEHKNPIHKLHTQQMMPYYNDFIDRIAFKWRVEIEVEFKDITGKSYFRGAQLVAHCCLKNLTPYFEDQVEEIFNQANMAQYVTTHVKATIAGVGKVEQSDFTD